MEISVARQHPPSPADLSMPRSKGIVIGFWTVTALFCLQMGFTAYAQLRLPQVAEMVLLAQEFDHLPLFPFEPSEQRRDKEMQRNQGASLRQCLVEAVSIDYQET